MTTWRSIWRRVAPSEKRALLDLLRHAAEEAHEEPGAEGTVNVGYDRMSDQIVLSMCSAPTNWEKGMNEDRRRDQVRQEDRDADRPVAGKRRRARP
jgi:hypothetical protein